MAEPLKNLYHEGFLCEFAEKVHGAFSKFNRELFIKDVINDQWEDFTLKERIRHISTILGHHLPSNYEDALHILFKIDEQCRGFEYLFFPDFVEVYGQREEHWDLSMKALERFTPKSSSEFAVRPFLLKEPERMIDQMTIWANHSDEHVRRLASEGCRPRLPWGQALPMFKKDPTLPLSVLEILNADSSLYVRKSVANNLNDISKDHPSIVIETARKWKGNNQGTNWIIRHACRTLVRKSIPEVMELFDYAKTEEVMKSVTNSTLKVEPSNLTIGETSEINYEIHIQSENDLLLRIEYAIDFFKSRGQTSRKQFLLVDKKVPGGTIIKRSRQHSWKDLSTRKHFPGSHRIVLLVNGIEMAEDIITLKQ